MSHYFAMSQFSEGQKDRMLQTLMAYGEVGSRDNGNYVAFDVTNGVSTADLVAMQGHIPGLNLIPKPYARLAADVNNSGSITHLDQILIRKVILGVSPSFGAVPNFRVVPQYALAPQWNFATPFEANPFEAVWSGINNGNRPYKADQNNPHSYLDHVPFNLLNPDALLEDTWTFYAVKSGNVNFSFDPENAQAPLQYKLETESHNCIPANEKISILLILSGEETLEGYQLGLAVDPAALFLTGVEQGELSPFGADYLSIKEDGKLATLWYNQDAEPLEIEDGKVLCKIYLHTNRIYFLRNFRLAAWHPVLSIGDEWEYRGRLYY